MVVNLTVRMAPLMCVHMSAYHRTEGFPRRWSRGGCSAVRCTTGGHGPGLRRRCMPTTAGQTPRAGGWCPEAPVWWGHGASWAVRAGRLRSSHAASMHQPTVMTLPNALSRSGVVRAREAATTGGSVRNRRPRAAGCWPGSPVSQAAGDPGGSSRACVAQRPHRGCATHASRRATAEARAPSLGSRTGSGGTPWPGRPRVRARGVGCRRPWCRDVRGPPGAHVASAGGAAGAPAHAVRHRG